MPSVRSWIVRPYAPGDEKEILQLFSQGGFVSRTEAQFRWQVLDVPCAVPTVWVAEDHGKIVGTYCGTPIQMRLCGRVSAAIHGNNAMTAPGYRRQGVLTQLFTTAAHSWSAAGFRLQTGVPWGNWGSRRAALGWIPLLGLVWMRCWLRPEQALARRLSLPTVIQQAVAVARPYDRLSAKPLRQPVPDVRVRELVEPEPALDQVWSDAEDAWDHLVVRNRDWVAWRYFNSPDFRYRILIAERVGRPVGFIALRVEHSPGGGTRGHVADLFARPEERDARLALLHAALERFRYEGVELALALVTEGGPVQRQLAAAGFSARAHDHFYVLTLDPKLPLDVLRRPEQWHVMGGDFDVV